QPSGVKEFKYAALTGVEKGWVDNLCAPAKLSQCGKVPQADLSTLNSGQTIVDFLRGSNQYAGTLLRRRTHVLGDIVDSTAAYVSAPRFNFADATAKSYADFKQQWQTRRGMVYVGAND